MARTTIRTEDVTDSEVTTAKMATDPTDASTLASGTVPTARLGSGSATSSTVLHGDNTWAAVSGLPTQTSNSGKVLITDGTDASWALYSNRNIIINGAMGVSQRSTSVASVVANGYYAADRWKWYIGTPGTSVFTISRETDSPAGFGHSTKIINTTAGTIAAGTELFVSQQIEGLNLQQIQKGTATAQQVTVSFWIKATQIGTYILELYDMDNSRTCSQSYTVSVTATWEYKTVTFPADTTGAFGADIGGSLWLDFWMRAGTTFSSGTLATTWAAEANANRAVGQVDALDTLHDAVQITGVQLEVGALATTFEYKTYGQELAGCQRYYYEISSAFAAVTATTIVPNIQFPVTMRDVPTVTHEYGGVVNDIYQISNGATPTFVANGAFPTAEGYKYAYDFDAGLTVEGHQTSWTFDAEL